MALRHAFSPLQRALLPSLARTLDSAIRPVTTSAGVWQGEAAQQAQPRSQQGAGWGKTKVFDILRSKPDPGAWLWCSKDDYVIDAVRKMTKGNVGSLLVFDPAKLNLEDVAQGIKEPQRDAVVGIVTERDYLTKVVVKGKNSSSLYVSEIMTPESKVMTVAPSKSVADVMEMMINHNFRHVPVVDAGSYKGMVSIRDVVATMVREHKEEVGQLHDYIQGTY